VCGERKDLFLKENIVIPVTLAVVLRAYQRRVCSYEFVPTSLERHIVGALGLATPAMELVSDLGFLDATYLWLTGEQF
jgi:hypothetical protein